MTYASKIEKTIENEFGSKYGLTTRMTVAKFKKEQKLVKYLARSFPMKMCVDENVTTGENGRVSVYDIVSIDAVKDGCGCWMYNDQYFVGETTDKELTEEVIGNSRKLLKWLRDNEYLGEDSKGKVKVSVDDTVVEVQFKSSSKPFLAIYIN